MNKDFVPVSSFTKNNDHLKSSNFLWMTFILRVFTLLRLFPVGIITFYSPWFPKVAKTSILNTVQILPNRHKKKTQRFTSVAKKKLLFCFGDLVAFLVAVKSQNLFLKKGQPVIGLMATRNPDQLNS